MGSVTTPDGLSNDDPAYLAYLRQVFQIQAP
jgi:hypothetical protein